MFLYFIIKISLLWELHFKIRKKIFFFIMLTFKNILFDFLKFYNYSISSQKSKQIILKIYCFNKITNKKYIKMKVNLPSVNIRNIYMHYNVLFTNN